jgi:hypothetical protein
MSHLKCVFVRLTFACAADTPNKMRSRSGRLNSVTVSTKRR